jgi:hypothetical protein
MCHHTWPHLPFKCQLNTVASQYLFLFPQFRIYPPGLHNLVQIFFFFFFFLRHGLAMLPRLALPCSDLDGTKHMLKRLLLATSFSEVLFQNSGHSWAND